MDRVIIFDRVVWDGNGTKPVDPSGNEIAVAMNNTRVIPIRELKGFTLSVGSASPGRLTISAMQISMHVSGASSTGTDEDVLIALVNEMTPARAENVKSYFEDQILEVLTREVDAVRIVYLANAQFDAEIPSIFAPA